MARVVWNHSSFPPMRTPNQRTTNPRTPEPRTTDHRDASHRPGASATVGRLVRGTVDCLIETASDRFTLLELKTGRPRPEHRTQLEVYVQAMRQAFPAVTVDARLVYS